MTWDMFLEKYCSILQTAYEKIQCSGMYLALCGIQVKADWFLFVWGVTNKLGGIGGVGSQ